MRIGIVTSVQYSMFSGGSTNTAIAVGEALKLHGHSVDLVNYSRGSQAWWDDCKALKVAFPVIRLPDASGYDLLIELDRFYLPPTERKKVAKKAVWLHRHPFLMAETEHSLFPTNNLKRDLSGVAEIWLFDTCTRGQDKEAAEALFGLPVRVVPFLWSSSPAKTLLEEFGNLSWKATAKEALGKGPTDPSKIPWSLHCAETNTNNTSSAILPMIIVREASRREIPISTWRIHNTDQLKENKFFLENTVKHSTDIGPSGELMSRQRIPSWIVDPFSLLISHMRFKQIRPALLDSIYCGIPTIHNSPLLSRIKGLEWYSYKSNEVGGACDALQRIQTDFQLSEGFFAEGALEKVREQIELHWGSSSPLVSKAYDVAVRGLMGEAIQPLRSSMKTPGTLCVGFSDMWADFQPEYNFFTQLLSAAAPNITIIGKDADGTEDLILFGPFGLKWQTFPQDIPKVHFTGENTVGIKGPGIVMNLGFGHYDMEDGFYLRFPLWLLYIDWFNSDPKRIVNPLPIPLERCTKVFIDEIAQKKKFCAFVATNPSNPVRNTAFHWLSEYKTVDSAGRLFNNMGPSIFASMGGGGGEQQKVEFLKDYKFSLTYENSSSSGYCTEKFLHAKAAGCVPIYWGDPNFECDFDVNGCIDARKFRTPEELVEAVAAVDTNDSEWLKKYATPALDSSKVAWARRTMAECARRMFAAVGYKDPLPRYIGSDGKGSKEPLVPLAPLAPQVSPLQTLQEKKSSPVIVTYTNNKFFQNLHFWLLSLAGHKRATKDLGILVFLAADVPQEKLAPLIQKFPYVLFERVPEQEVPEGFPDFWDPQHYGFKLWIYNYLASSPFLNGNLVLYTDVASFMCRLPSVWMQKAFTEGVCFLEDPREENARWCSAAFKEKMAVTEAENAALQRLGGLVCFRAGSPLACTVFSEAYQLSQDRTILAGPKWAGIREDGKPFGHRHDQSILSILSLRHNVPVEPLDTVYGDTSLRATYKAGKAIYVHRGNFQVHRPFTAGIDEVYCINLDRRKDRMDRLLSTHSDLSGVVERWPAIDGRSLTLTPAIAKLLKPNDFFWKKAVTGCALSHLGLWWKLANEKPEINSFLILEDDVKFRPGWSSAWKNAVVAGAIPDDADIIYLGGILPPNRAGFEEMKERINDYVSRVAPNQCFGQGAPTRYFHFCAYAYVLTRQGADKIIGLLNSSKGYWTSADHILCNRVDVMNMYFLDPLVAGCYQDDDPTYATSNFNDFSRVDSFDSDLWNNDERFTQEEIDAALLLAGETIPFEEALADAKRGGPALEAVEAEKAAETVEAVEAEKKEEQKEQKEKKEKKEPNAGSGIATPLMPSAPFKLLNRSILANASAKIELSKLYEYEWLLNLFGNPTLCQIEDIGPSSPPRLDTPLILIQGKQYLEQVNTMLERWDSLGVTFYILHLSDEFCNDTIRSYDLSGCLGVIRNYIRPDTIDHPKVVTIPLGYHWAPPDGSFGPVTLRQNDWCFMGTGWKDRIQLLSPLIRQGIKHYVKYFEQWNDPEQLTRPAYINTMLNTIFVPCPEGMNAETFRFYEALECGAIPLVVETETSIAWINWLKKSLPLLSHTSWEEVVAWMQTILKDKEALEEYRTKLLDAWVVWRKALEEQVQQWIVASDAKRST